jgi:hypothetical protein
MISPVHDDEGDDGGSNGGDDENDDDDNGNDDDGNGNDNDDGDDDGSGGGATAAFGGAASGSEDAELWMPWCGILISTVTLSTRLDLSRYEGNYMRDTITAELARKPGESVRNNTSYPLPSP